MEADNILAEINKASLQLLEPHSLDEVYKIIVEEAVTLVNCDDGMIVRSIDNELTTVYGSSKKALRYKVHKMVIPILPLMRIGQ